MLKIPLPCRGAIIIIPKLRKGPLMQTTCKLKDWVFKLFSHHIYGLPMVQNNVKHKPFINYTPLQKIFRSLGPYSPNSWLLKNVGLKPGYL